MTLTWRRRLRRLGGGVAVAAIVAATGCPARTQDKDYNQTLQTFMATTADQAAHRCSVARSREMATLRLDFSAVAPLPPCEKPMVGAAAAEELAVEAVADPAVDVGVVAREAPSQIGAHGSISGVLPSGDEAPGAVTPSWESQTAQASGPGEATAAGGRPTSAAGLPVPGPPATGPVPGPPREGPPPGNSAATVPAVTTAPPIQADRRQRAADGLTPDQQRLMAAYPAAFTIEGNEVVFPSGERLVWDDGREKSPDELLTNPDIEDMFHYPYPPAGLGLRDPFRLHDPGRVRNDAFFKALYGQSVGAVRSTLTNVPWVPRLGGGSVAATSRFEVDERLARVSAELAALPRQFHKYLAPSGGTFNWRVIAGTSRMSVHSFGAAIDINTKFTNYWRWDKAPRGGNITYRNQIPIEIVAIFEKHCFVWGGRWYHYDTMHFEFRPELIPHCSGG